MSSTKGVTPGRVWLEWQAAVTGGIVSGMAVVLGMIAVLSVDRFPLGFGLLVVTCGLVHGAIVGGAQALVLGRHLPGFHPGRFVLATALASAAAWGLVIAAWTWTVLEGIGAQEMLLLFVVGGFGVGSVIGAGQWLALRRMRPGAGWWIPANGVSWVVGTAVLLAGLPGIFDSPTAMVAVGRAAQIMVAIGLLASTVTGFFVVALWRGRVPRLGGRSALDLHLEGAR